MAGGLFGKPFAFNIKCIVFALIQMALFLYKPTFATNYSLYGTLFIIFVVAYVAMAWYDAFFDCRILPLRRGEYSLQKFIKPSPHMPEKQVEWSCEQDTKRKNILVYLFHLLLIAPLIGYVAINKTKVAPMVYPILGALALFTLGYHGSYLLFASHKGSNKFLIERS